jgi:hypothetical protein
MDALKNQCNLAEARKQQGASTTGFPSPLKEMLRQA